MGYTLSDKHDVECELNCFNLIALSRMAAERPHAQATSTPLVDRLKQISRSTHKYDACDSIIMSLSI